MKIRHLKRGLAAGALALITLCAWADEGRGRSHDRPSGGVPRGDVRSGGVRHAPFAFDNRYFHNHYYPSRGYFMPALPGGSVSLTFGGGRYYYHSGVWWRPAGVRFEVIMPPFGIVVPILPADAVALMVAGIVYYYANGVYYRHEPGEGYVVVAPPSGVEQAQPQQQAASVPKAPPAPVIYPRNGQSSAQTEADRQDCNRWATTQPAAMADGEVFLRAFAACMDARGYTVR